MGVHGPTAVRPDSIKVKDSVWTSSPQPAESFSSTPPPRPKSLRIRQLTEINSNEVRTQDTFRSVAPPENWCLNLAVKFAGWRKEVTFPGAT